MTPEAYTRLQGQRFIAGWHRRCFHRRVVRWEADARELAAEHKGIYPVHYFLHQTKWKWRHDR